MISQPKFLPLFFDQWEAFMDELIRVFPAEEEFPRLKSQLHIGRTANPKRVITAVQQTILPFEALVRAKNADFFLKYPFNEYQDNQEVLTMVRKMKQLWFQMSVPNQKAVFDYMILLLELLHRYLGSK
jgi:hypothetical protein